MRIGTGFIGQTMGAECSVLIDGVRVAFQGHPNFLALIPSEKAARLMPPEQTDRQP